MAKEWRVTLALTIGLALAVGSVSLMWAQRAAAEAIASGTTRLELNSGLFKTLKKEGVQMTKAGRGSISGRIIKVPVSGGLIDIGTANGWIDSIGGGVRFQAGKRSVKLTGLSLDTSKGALRATLDGQQMKLAAVQSYEFSRVGWGDAVEAAGLRLTRRASTLLNRELGLDVFRPGRTSASVFSSIQPEWNQVVGGNFQFSFDADFVAKIRSLELELTLGGSSAPVSEPPVFIAPLMAGSIDPTMVHTSGSAEGGFTIADPDSPGPTADWFNLGFSFETERLLSTSLAHTKDGQLAPAPPGPLAVVHRAGTTLRVDPVSRTVTLSNAPATLEAGVADYLNRTFAVPRGKGETFAVEDPLGTVSMTMQGR